MGKETSVAVSMFGIVLSKKMIRIDVTYEVLVYMHGAFDSDINQDREQNDIEPINNQTLLPPINISPQNVSLYQDSIGITHIVGMITNPFTFPIRSVQVTASAHNAQNQLISTG